MAQQDLEVFDMLSTLLVSISSGQQILQCIRQVLTSNPIFNPMALFKYLTRGNHILTRKALLSFLESQNANVSQDHMKILFQCYGLRDQMQYTDFLNYVYPLNSGILRQIASVHIKRYPQTQKLPVNEDIVTTFYLLLTEEVQLIDKIEVQKSDSFPRLPKEKLRKILKSIKKASEKQQSHCQNTENGITSLQLRNFIKAFVDVGDHQFLHLGRRLGMDSRGLITLQSLQFWLRPWKKNPRSASQNHTPSKKQRLVKDFDEGGYRESLNQQLSQTLNFSKQKIHKQKQQVVPSFRQTHDRQRRSQILKGNYLLVFKEFVDKVVASSEELEKLKIKFNDELKVNLLHIFKRIDTYERGTVKAQDIKRFYYGIGGIPINIDFDLIVERYSQTADNQLAYSEFCEMFSVGSGKQNILDRGASGFISQQGYRIVSQILYLNLQNEAQLKKIRNKFKRGEAKILFDTISKEGNGFINYQELKKFLNQFGKVLSMQDLMILLKRLDRSKNGVVVENQFIQYFEPKL